MNRLTFDPFEIDAIFDRLRRAGRSLGEAKFGPHWVVSGTQGTESLEKS